MPGVFYSQIGGGGPTSKQIIWGKNFSIALFCKVPPPHFSGGQGGGENSKKPLYREKEKKGEKNNWQIFPQEVWRKFAHRPQI